MALEKVEGTFVIDFILLYDHKPTVTEKYFQNILKFQETRLKGVFVTLPRFIEIFLRTFRPKILCSANSS